MYADFVLGTVVGFMLSSAFCSFSIGIGLGFMLQEKYGSLWKFGEVAVQLSSTKLSMIQTIVQTKYNEFTGKSTNIDLDISDPVINASEMIGSTDDDNQTNNDHIGQTTDNVDITLSSEQVEKLGDDNNSEEVLSKKDN
jgi:hypothetical protein